MNPVPAARRAGGGAIFRSANAAIPPTWVVMGQLGEGRAARRAAAWRAPFEQASSTSGLERTNHLGRLLPGGQVMWNWRWHGNDWHVRISASPFSGDPVR